MTTVVRTIADSAQQRPTLSVSPLIPMRGCTRRATEEGIEVELFYGRALVENRNGLIRRGERWTHADGYAERVLRCWSC